MLRKSIYAVLIITTILAASFIISCANKATAIADVTTICTPPDTLLIPTDSFGTMVTYGRNIMLHTAYYIGPNGINGKYTKNKMNCTNCHQNAGTKPYSYNLQLTQARYPQYRAREDKVLSLANRVNNCIMRPHSGVPLPLDGKEMTAILSYLRWIYSQANTAKGVEGYENLNVALTNEAASPVRGAAVYAQQCMRCHGANGEGVMLKNNITYEYPPVWGMQAYQPGSSMHRVIKQARWLKANMPHEIATWYAPKLTDKECLDVAAYVNDDSQHPRPTPIAIDYPNVTTKPLDYGRGPYADTFSEAQHKYGPYPPIIAYWKAKGWKVNY